MKKIIIYTDGACSGNPGPGGYAAILQYNGSEREISGAEEETTNNRMELMAVIAALDALKEPCEVEVVSDSQYVVNGITKGWAQKWRANNWMRSKKEKAINADLWEKLLNCLEKHTVVFTWVRGHEGHPENERCDKMAVAEYMKLKGK